MPQTGFCSLDLFCKTALTKKIHKSISLAYVHDTSKGHRFLHYCYSFNFFFYALSPPSVFCANFLLVQNETRGSHQIEE